MNRHLQTMVRVQSRQEKRTHTNIILMTPEPELPKRPSTSDQKFSFATPRKISTSLRKKSNNSAKANYKLCSSKTVFVFTPRQSPPANKIVPCKRKAPTPTFGTYSEPVEGAELHSKSGSPRRRNFRINGTKASSKTVGERDLLLEWQMQSTQLAPTPWQSRGEGLYSEDSFLQPSHQFN